jgi:hypothetical protein
MDNDHSRHKIQNLIIVGPHHHKVLNYIKEKSYFAMVPSESKLVFKNKNHHSKYEIIYEHKHYF